MSTRSGDRASGKAGDRGSRKHRAVLAALVSMLEDARTARTLEDAAVRQVGLALRLMWPRAQPRIRNWLNRTEQLRLLPRPQRLLEVVGHRNQLRLMQRRAVHQHADWSAG